jgi:opacity protein-like surface antigen
VLRGVFTIFGTGLAALVAFSAFAADLPSPALTPATLSPAPAPDWRGLYAGSFAGVEQGIFSTRQTASASGTAWGFSTGVLVGYNWQSGLIVYGLEGDISNNSATSSFGAVPGLVANGVDNLYALHARGRLGYDLGAFLPFAAVGAAYGRTEQYQLAPLDSHGETQDRLGWTAGAGVDVKVALPILGPSVLRAEYLYESFPATYFDLNGPRLRTNVGDQTLRFAIISRDGEVQPAPMADAVDWSGDYVGVMGGAAWDTVSTSGQGASDKITSRGPLAGLYAGQNWMFSETMLGLEGATTLANVVGRGPQPGAALTSYRDFVESDFRGRVGYAFGRFMPFMATGLAYGQAQQTDLISGDERGNTPVLAWTTGVGLDYMLSERLSLRAEYLFARTFASRTTDLDNDNCCSQTRVGDALRLGLAYYFH